MRKSLWILGAVLILGAGLLFRFWPHQPLPAGTRADSILVDKRMRSLSLLKDGQLITSYRVALGRHPEGHKMRRWDGRTPEGHYFVSRREPHSRFYRALEVSYPNAEDKRRAAEMSADPGDDIMIHGIKNGLGWLGRFHRLVDWTDGCIAVTNEEMLDIWNATSTGRISIVIRP